MDTAGAHRPILTESTRGGSIDAKSLPSATRSPLLALLRHPSFALGAGMLVVVMALAIVGPAFIPYDPIKVSMGEKLQAMSLQHFLGTDAFGRDILARLAMGARYSLAMAGSAIAVAMISGTACGLIAGFYPAGFVGRCLVWLTDIFLAFPTLILGAFVAMILGPGVVHTAFALVLAFFPRFVRIARGATLAVREDLYVSAGISLGMTERRLLARHVVPNMISPVIVMAIIWASDAISLEVALSFLGLGVQPPTPSWGSMLQDNLRYFHLRPSSVLLPCAPVALVVQGLNLIGDRFRDVLDPNMR